ncbi:MAG: DoxX family membrane protein [Candidatus Nanohaloarchaea archaeon]
MNLERIFDYRQEAALYGLATVFLLAGVSKFFTPSLWTGYEPGFVTGLLPLTAKQFTYAAGHLEGLIGLLLFFDYRTRKVASIATLWLLAITISVATMQLWTIALRDLGLVALAYTVAAGD